MRMPVINKIFKRKAAGAKMEEGAEQWAESFIGITSHNIPFTTLYEVAGDG